jgi:hypothetical protein
MAEPLLEFDPTSEDAANSPLSVWNTASYGVTAFSPDAAQQSVQWASSVDTEGALPASFKDENRTISLTVECLSAAALRALQAKVMKISRERGTLKYTLPNSEVIVFDLLARASFSPTFDDKYVLNTGAYCTVEMSFAAKPYGRGASTSATLTGGTATSKLPIVATATGIKGDVPALGTLTVANATNAKTAALWGIQSRYYSAATSAALVLEAEDGVASGAALNAGSAGASGGGANKVMRHLDVGTSGGSISYLLGYSGGTQTLSHVGSFRVLARVQALSTNTGIVSIRLGWYPRWYATQVTNDWVPIVSAAGAAVTGSWVLVDLGMITIPKARSGSQQWRGEIDVKSTVATDDIDYDWIALLPCDEGTGRLEAATITSTDSVEFSPESAQIVRSGLWGDPTSYEGDYVRIPPAGAEARSLRVLALLAGATAGGNLTDTVIDAVNLDATTATLTYVPRYLVVPEP